jgi:hypothetical protein
MTTSELEKRIQGLEDIEEIKQLQVRYVNCVITNKWDELVDCFSKDGSFSAHAGDAKGKEAIKKLFLEDISLNHIGLEGLFAVHPIIKVDGDKAEGSWLLYIQFALPRKLKFKIQQLPTNDAPDWLQGYYDMKYVKEDGKWKISYLKYRTRLISPMPGNSSNR